MCTLILIKPFTQSAIRRNPQLSRALGGLLLLLQGHHWPTGSPPEMMLPGTGTLSQHLSHPQCLDTGCSPAGKVIFRNKTGSAVLSPCSSLGQLFLSLLTALCHSQQGGQAPWESICTVFKFSLFAGKCPYYWKNPGKGEFIIQLPWGKCQQH